MKILFIYSDKFSNSIKVSSKTFSTGLNVYFQIFFFRYRETNSKSWNWIELPVNPPDARKVKIHNLTPRTKYEFQVTSFNEFGDGMYSQIIEAQTKGKNWISSSQEKYFVWLSNFILLERIFSFIYSQAADGGLEFSVLNDGDPTASPSESKPTNTGKLLKIQNSSRTRVEHLIRTRFELPPSNTWMNYYTCSQDTLFHFSFAKNEKKSFLIIHNIHSVGGLKYES